MSRQTTKREAAKFQKELYRRAGESSHEKALAKKGRVATAKDRKKNPYLSADSIVYPKKK